MAQPMYQQIADDLRDKIETGELAPGAQLPTELELREKYEASRNTIRDAIKRLTSLGLVQTRPGQGTFVTQKIDPFVTILTSAPDDREGTSSDPETAAYLSEVSGRHRKARVTRPRVEIQVPPIEIGSRLRIEPGSQVISRHQQRFIDEIPWSLQTSYYPMDFVAKAPLLLMAEDRGPVVKYLEKSLDLKQVGYRDWVTARTPDQNEQIFFKISHDTTVFEVFRTGFDEVGTPMRVTVTIFPADRNQFIVNVGRVPDPQYEWDSPGTQD